MIFRILKYIFTLAFLISFQIVTAQQSVHSKDLVKLLYDQHDLSFELKNNEKKGVVFVEYLQDGNHQFEIALLDRIPINVIDSEDILRITVSDTSKAQIVYQNTFDKGINDMQDFDKKMIEEFSKVILTEKPQSLQPIYSFNTLKIKVYHLQEQKIHKNSKSVN